MTSIANKIGIVKNPKTEKKLKHIFLLLILILNLGFAYNRNIKF